MQNYEVVHNHLKNRKLGLKDQIWTTNFNGVMQYNFCGTFSRWTDKHCRGFNRPSFNEWAVKNKVNLRYCGTGIFKEVKL